MILAAATEFYIRKTKKIVVLCGANHGEIFKQLESLGFEPKDGYEELEQGFVDNHGNFLTREKAYEHAKACGQLCQKIIYEREHGGVGGRKLISEDLW